MIFLISAILNCEISGETNFENHVTLWAVMATADRATCNTRAHAPLIDQAVGLLVSSLFLKQLGERDFYVHVCQHQT